MERASRGPSVRSPGSAALAPTPTGSYLLPMSRSPGAQRAKALFLLLVLLVGGFGLPIFDGIRFHSKAIAEMATQDQAVADHDAGRAHLYGCAVWSSPAASTGLPEFGTPPTTVAVASTDRPAVPTAVIVTQHGPTLALPRAPPSV